MVFPICCLSVSVSPRMPSLPAPNDSSACRVIKQLDHLTNALLLFMFPKCLALFTKLSSTVCLESLINPARLCREKKNKHHLSIAQSHFCMLGCVCERFLPVLVLPFSSPSSHSFTPVDSCGLRPYVSLTILTAYFHHADEGGPVEHCTLGRRGCMLLLCTTLFGTLAALHTCHPP